MMIETIVKILAVVGGGVIGGVGLGLLAQLLSRAFTAKKLPRWSAVTVRLLGGVICGWLVLGLFGGGLGFGGPGGWGIGSGSGKSEGEKSEESVKKNSANGKGSGESKLPPGEILRIEVLGKNALKKTDIETSRYYRIDAGDGSRLLTLAQIKDAVQERRSGQPPLRRIEIVLYKDSPDEHVPIVAQLRNWASELDGGKMKVDISQPDADAPRQ
jgi:hypothetical protein